MNLLEICTEESRDEHLGGKRGQNKRKGNERAQEKEGRERLTSPFWLNTKKAWRSKGTFVRMSSSRVVGSVTHRDHGEGGEMAVVRRKEEEGEVELAGSVVKEDKVTG